MSGLAPFFADIASFEKALGLKDNFIVSLLNEDDWSFVIKSQALIETILTKIVVAKADPRLENVIGRMSLSGGRVSKVQAAVDLEVLSTPMQQLIADFTEMRNQFVHNPRFLNGSLSEYLRNQNSDKTKQLISRIVSLIDNEKKVVSDKMLEEFTTSPKQVLCIAVIYILGHLILHVNPLQKEQIDKMIEENGLVIGLVLLGVILFGIYRSDQS